MGQPSRRPVSLYQAMRRGRLSNVTLARILGMAEGAVWRMFDLDHQPRIGTLEKALWQLGKQMVSDVRRAASERSLGDGAAGMHWIGRRRRLFSAHRVFEVIFLGFAHPERFSNPGLIRNIVEDGIRLG
jgi:hypothetical protein